MMFVLQIVLLIVTALVSAFIGWFGGFLIGRRLAGRLYDPVKTKYKVKPAKSPGAEATAFKLDPSNVKQWDYSYLKMQDARLLMNRKDNYDQTPLFVATLKKDWKMVESLLERGALVDVPCGTQLRTALHELVIAKDLVHAEWFLKKGAWILQPDILGENPDTWADRNGFHTLFDKYQNNHTDRRVIPKDTPRSYHILAVNPHGLSAFEKRGIPERIADKITWGYNCSDKTDLNAFTHIVVPRQYCNYEQCLYLTDETLFLFKWVASWAVLMHEDWLVAMGGKEDVYSNEEAYILHDMQYEGYLYEESIFHIKTNIHMGRPGFLKNVKVTILETQDKEVAARKSEWEKIIVMFGGTNVKVPVGDVDENSLPYTTLYPDYTAAHLSQNSCWILKFDDSQINEIWRSDVDAYTLVPFHFLPHCIASGTIWSQFNERIPLDYKAKDPVKTSKSKKVPKVSIRSVVTEPPSTKKDTTISTTETIEVTKTVETEPKK